MNAATAAFYRRLIAALTRFTKSRCFSRRFLVYGLLLFDVGLRCLTTRHSLARREINEALINLELKFNHLVLNWNWWKFWIFRWVKASLLKARVASLVLKLRFPLATLTTQLWFPRDWWRHLAKTWFELFSRVKYFDSIIELTAGLKLRMKTCFLFRPYKHYTYSSNIHF